MEGAQPAVGAADGPAVKWSPEPSPDEHPDSTRHVALARLPERRLGKSPHARRVVTQYREFKDGEVIPGTRYRVTHLIGAGGMGSVYEVEHVELGKRFVLKSLLRELSRREDLVGRMRNEWRALARLDHPCIVNVTDAGTSENGVPFFVMERLEGETLASTMHRQRRLHPQQALALAAGMLEGLHAAHQIGIVHRDVKPSNVILVGPTTVKILDFGIAKIRDAKDVVTARGYAVGTPRYMSPEQAQGTPVDARSDVYATGLILFEMVSGVGPFDDARDNNELLLAHIGRRAPLLSSISVVAPELDAIVASMLAKDPRERPADARIVAETLRALSQRYARYPASDAPTLNPPAATPEVPTRVDGPRRRASVAATRPDGVAARAAAGDTTTAQPAFEIATTAAHTLPRSSVTLRLDEAAPPTLYGPDTLVDAVTGIPTAVPGATPERTEVLLAAPPSPSGHLLSEPGPTRTAVPVGEAPNLTPPPVVPAAASLAPVRPRSTKVPALLGLGGAVLITLVGWLAFRAPASEGAAPSSATLAEPVAAPATLPAAVTSLQPRLPVAPDPPPVAADSAPLAPPPTPQGALAPAASPASAATESATPGASLHSGGGAASPRKEFKKSPKPAGAFAGALQRETGDRPARAEPAPPAARSKASSALPGSGL